MYISDRRAMLKRNLAYLISGGLIVFALANELKGEIIGARFLDINGNIRRVADDNGAVPAALVFVDAECPVSARYLGELNDGIGKARWFIGDDNLFTGQVNWCSIIRDEV